MDFNVSPFITFWEVTRACSLACRHCRAEAQPRRHSQELTTEEGYRLMDQIYEMGNPLFVLTGGDPMMRQDLYDLVNYGVKKGLRVSLAPSATKLVTKDALQRLKDAGLLRLSFSVDGSNAAIHDAFRQTPGAFQRTVEILRDVNDVGLSLQVNTTVSRFNVNDLESLAQRIAEFKPAMWSVFFLVPTGRGKDETMISPEEHEEVFNWLYDFAQRAPFDVKTTAAQHFRRVTIQRKRSEAGATPAGRPALELAAPGFSYGDAVGRAMKGVNDGNGCLFVSHIGEVCPSGFLPLVAGNVKEQPLAEIYRNSQLFRDLRDTSKLKGKCGRCNYNRVCGGSRARAYAATGDYLEAEPYCVYDAAAIRGQKQGVTE
jgi:radical SAM protein